jgi:hypothetical protein
MDEKRFRLDFVIAFFALLISTVAAIAAIYQTRVIAQQFSATVWPYVSFDVTYSPTAIEVALRNDGLGPAIIRSVAITLDGKPQASIEALLAALGASQPHAQAALRAALRAGSKMSITMSTPTAGMVIPANEQHVLIRADGAVLMPSFKPAIRRVGISLCYCSLTGTCWTQSFRSRDSEPHPVSSCLGRS